MEAKEKLQAAIKSELDALNNIESLTEIPPSLRDLVKDTPEEMLEISINNESLTLRILLAMDIFEGLFAESKEKGIISAETVYKDFAKRKIVKIASEDEKERKNFYFDVLLGKLIGVRKISKKFIEDLRSALESGAYADLDRHATTEGLEGIRDGIKQALAKKRMN